MDKNLLEERISQIEARNTRVELDKAWETSPIRRLLIAVFTYAVMVLVMSSIGVSDPFVSAVIPTLGFILSTLSLSFMKDYWIKHQKKV